MVAGLGEQLAESEVTQLVVRIVRRHLAKLGDPVLQRTHRRSKFQVPRFKFQVDRPTTLILRGEAQ